MRPTRFDEGDRTAGPSRPDTGPTDRRGLRVLDLEDCLSRVAHEAVGRVGFVTDGEVVVLPVSHLLDGTGVSFVTTWGSKLQVAADGGRMAFEVDESHASTRTGWSVLLQGTASVVHDEAHVHELETRFGGLWAPASSPLSWVHLRPDSVSGREIVQPG